MLGGVDRVQIRERRLDGRALLAFAEALSDAARRARPGVEIVVNRRIDVALLIGADGVHLGFDALAIAEARALLGAGAKIGASTHSVAEAETAIRAGADYVHLAPVFAPLSKSSTRPALGLDRLAEACARSGRVIAQGGVDPDRIVAIVRTGVAGVAVTGHLLAAADPRSAAEAMRTSIDEAARQS